MPSTTQSAKTYLFVHGAWHASWCWNKIAGPICEAGHRVLTPDLPGHGENYEPAIQVSLQTYVESIMEIANAQPEPVTLVGHSMAGIILSQVADKIPDKIDELIFLSAYIPKDGDSLFSMAESGNSHAVAPLLVFDNETQQISLTSPTDIINTFFNNCNTADAEFALAHLQSQPLQPFLTPVKLGNHFQRVSKKAIVCNNDNAITPSDQLKYCQGVTDNIIYLDADHAAYFSASDSLIELLSI